MNIQLINILQNHKNELLLIIGFILGFILTQLLKKPLSKQEKDISKLKPILKDSYSYLQKAAEEQRKLYVILNKKGG